MQHSDVDSILIHKLTLVPGSSSLNITVTAKNSCANGISFIFGSSPLASLHLEDSEANGILLILGSGQCDITTLIKI